MPHSKKDAKMDRKDKLHETIPEVSPAVPCKTVATPSPHDLALRTCDSTPIVPHAAALRRRTRSQRCHATLNRVPSDLRDEELQQLHLLRSAEESRPVHVGWQVAARSNGKIPGRKWWVVTLSSPARHCQFRSFSPGQTSKRRRPCLPSQDFLPTPYASTRALPSSSYAMRGSFQHQNSILTHTVALCNSQCIP